MMLLLFTIACLFVAPFYCIYKPPGFVMRYFQRRWPDVLWQVSTTSKIVALTIDDGPSEFTEGILDVLRANNATATFFVIGSQIRGSREDNILEAVVRQGHELGNHAMRDEPSRGLSDEELTTEIGTVEDRLRAIYTTEGVHGPPKYFRPGSGFFSDRMRANVAKLGYQLVLGSVYPHDPQIPYWRVNARHILSMVRPGSIIICHDRRKWTLPMLQKVLPELQTRGYRVVTVTELLKQTQKRYLESM